MLGFFYRKSVSGGVSLQSVLNAFQDKVIGGTTDGNLIVSTSGNGRSVSMVIPDFLKTFTPDDAADLSQSLIEIYIAACATLVLPFPAIDDPSNDAIIYATMLASNAMQAIREWQNDYTIIRWPTVGSGGYGIS